MLYIEERVSSKNGLLGQYWYKVRFRLPQNTLLYEACGQTKWMNHKYLKILFNVVLRGKRRGKVELINQFFMSEMDKWFHSKYLSEK